MKQGIVGKNKWHWKLPLLIPQVGVLLATGRAS